MDKDRQKERLANIMAFGEDIDPKKKKQMAKTSPPVYEEPDIDRFDECEFKKKSLCAVYYNQSCILRKRNASYYYRYVIKLSVICTCTQNVKKNILYLNIFHILFVFEFKCNLKLMKEENS